MSEYGVPIPEPYNDPGNWPFRWCAYEDARGWVTRIRAEGSHEGKVIAQEVGVSWPTLKRAVRWFLISTGQYDPDSWLAYQRQRKAEARRRFLDRMTERHLKMKDERREIEQGRLGLAEQREKAEEALHVSTPRSEDPKARRRELQRKLNVRNRARASF
jgi:hypothetical protein